MKFAVFTKAALFALSTMLDSQTAVVQAVPIASTISSHNSMFEQHSSDVHGFAQWDVASPMGLIGLTADGEQEDRFHLGQLYSDTQDSSTLDGDMDQLS